MPPGWSAGDLPRLDGRTFPDVGPDGPFEGRGHPTIAGRSGAASDDAAARRLWALSEQQTGVAFGLPATV